VSEQQNAAPCAICTLSLGRQRDRVPDGLAHPFCAQEYRRQHAGKTDYDSRLPKHLR